MLAVYLAQHLHQTLETYVFFCHDPEFHLHPMRKMWNIPPFHFFESDFSQIYFFSEIQSS